MNSEWQQVADATPCLKELYGKSILITGATGTIGSRLVELLLFCNEEEKLNIKLICPLRNFDKVPTKLRNNRYVTWLKYNLTEPFKYDVSSDYVIHCAAPTRSQDMVSRPVDTIDAIVLGTKNMLEYFRYYGKTGFLYLSTVEIYGENENENKIYTENSLGAVDTLRIRSSYPEAKRLAENMCMAYSSQYNLPVKIARLSQVLGVSEGDNRLIGYLCDCAKNKTPIVLKSDGRATKAYCYISDCVSALIQILINGDNTAYNVANESLTMSVYDLASFVAQKYSCGNVIVENKDSEIYPKSCHLVLNTDKLRALGWQPYVGLEEAFDNLIKAR